MTCIDVLPAAAGTVGLTWEPAGGDYGPLAGVLTLDARRSRGVYAVAEFPTGWDGRGFTLKKADGSESYSVFCSKHGPEADSCECASATYRPGAPCKHLAAVRAMISNGWL